MSQQFTFKTMLKSVLSTRQVVALTLCVFTAPALTAQRPPNCGDTCGGGHQPPGTGGSFIQTQTAISNQRGAGGSGVAVRPAGKSVNIEGSQSYSYAVPLFSIPGRGLALNLTLYYNSLLWEFDLDNNSMVYASDFQFPSPGFSLGYGYVDFSTDLALGILFEPTGARHLFLPNGTANQYHTTDSSYIQIQYPTTTGGPVIATFKDGVRSFYQPFTVLGNNHTEYRPYQIEDTNGNFISIAYTNPNNLNISTITDTVGRVIQFTYDPTGTMLQSVAELPPNNNQVSALQYTFGWAQNQTLTFNFTLKATAGLNLPPGYLTSGQSTVNLLNKVSRPDGTSVSFDYVNDGSTNGNPDWGIIKTITELSAASTPAARYTTSYAFPAASAGVLTSNPTYTQQTVNDGVNTKTWAYQATKTGGLVTSFVTTDPCGNTVTTTFSANGDALDGLPVKDQIANTHPAPSGCPTDTAQTWRTVNKTWTTDADGSNPRPQTVSTVLEDGTSQSQVKFNSYDSFGQVTDLLEYDFGASGPGPLLREKVTAFASPGNGIVNRPSRITLKDGGGNTVARTDFNYDGYGTAGITDISPNPTGHDPAFTSSNTARGNLTSVTSYANAAAATGGVTSSFTYDATGNRLTSQAGCCTFGSQIFSSTTGYAYPDSVLTGPSGNSLSLTTSFTYNLQTGTLASTKDANNQTTSYAYDIDNRLITTTLPDSSTISQSYDDSSASPATTVSNSFNSLVKVTTVAGPTATEQVKNGTTLVSTKTVTADLLGRPVSVSNPFGPSDTAVYTTYTYDPLGRVTQVTPPGGTGSYQTSYGIESTSIDSTAHMISTVTSTDPAGKQRKRYTDGLGLRQVDEPGQSGGQAGSGSASVTGSEQSVSVQNGGGATAGTGSVAMSGTERSTQVLTHNATSGNATVTISGYEVSTTIDPCYNPDIIPPDGGSGPSCPQTVWDRGGVSVTVNGFTASVSYGSADTPSTIAAGLVGALNASGSPVTASCSNGPCSTPTITLTGRTTGAATNYTLSASSWTNDVNDFGGPSFSASPSGSTMTGGTDNGYTTMYDTGNVTMNVTINGTPYSKSSAYGQNSTPASIATDLANKINSDTTLNQLLIANSSGSTLNLTTKATGNATNDPLSASSGTNSSYFTPGTTSFTPSPSGSTLTPGQNGTVYDTGTVTVSITGFTATPYTRSVNYSQGSTPTSIASTIAGAFNADPLSPVGASASSGAVTVTAKTLGADTNYGVAVTSATTQTAYFAQPSFSGSAVSLSGGQDPTAALKTPLSTTYFYDALGRLLQVDQGAQQRVYAYDDLGRLTSAKVPETLNQATSYTYTDFGAVYQTTDARGIVTTNAYDALDRLSQITYSDTTPSITYTYGVQGAANFGGGRLIKVVDGSGTATLQYDLMGRGTKVSRAIGAQTYTTSYKYTNEQLDTVTYPSGRTVKITPDAIGRLNQIGSNGSNLMTIGSYNAAGEPLGATYGNGMAATYTYNSQLQLASLVSGSTTTPVLNLTYNYGSQDNGQIQSITDGLTASQSTSYAYDELGRLKTAGTNDLTSANTWKLKFSYDRYGNRLSEIPAAGTANMPFSEISVDPGSNRVTGLQYDAAGNAINDGLHGYTFNANNQIAQVDGSGSYVYDGGGQRVIKNGTVYIYDSGQVIAEYPNGAAPTSPSVEYVGKLASFAAGATTYYYSDHLSIRALADASGNVIGKQAQYPFGEIMTGLQSGTATKWQFTSYERDLASGDSGLDYAQARFYGSRFGRFTSLDPLTGSTADPQSLNRYAYVRNDPINLADPTGMSPNDPTSRCEILENGGIGFCAGRGGCTVDGQSVLDCGGVINGGFANECPSCGLLFYQVGNVAGIVNILNGVSFEETWDLSGISQALGEQSTSNNVYAGATSQGGYVGVATGQVVKSAGPFEGEMVSGSVLAVLYADPLGAMSLHDALGWAGGALINMWDMSEFLPGGDRKLGMDFLHCAGCPEIWHQSATAGNIIAVATAAVPVIAIGAGEAIIAGPTLLNLGTQGVAYVYYVLPATPFVVNQVLQFDYRFGIPGTLGLSWGTIKVVCGDFPGSCPGFMTPQGR